MASPAKLTRIEDTDSQLPSSANDAPTQAEIDAAHGTTGWSAYDVWRSRIFVPQSKGYNKPHGNS
jgi:hypothetical protein